jgi:hypothetical protein
VVLKLKGSTMMLVVGPSFPRNIKMNSTIVRLFLLYVKLPVRCAEDLASLEEEKRVSFMAFVEAVILV